jgi:hypothetical protein
MKRFFASLLTILCLAGCRAPKPSFDVLSPLGPTRVPPPGTTNYSAKGTYYNSNPPASTAPGGAVPSTGLPATPATMPPGTSPQRALQTATSQNRYLASDGAWRSPNRQTTAGLDQLMQVMPGSPTDSRSVVMPAAYNADVMSTGARQAPVGTGVSANAGQVASKSVLMLKGLPVTDTRQPVATAEPARFQPAANAIEISRLSPSTAISSSTAMSREVVSSAQASDQVQGSPPTTPSSDGGTTLNWRTRPASAGSGS